MEMRYLVILFVGSVAQDCFKYSCEKLPTSADTCGWFNATSSMWYLQPCGKSEQCGELNITAQVATCMPTPQPAPPILSPGLPCTSSNNCLLYNSTGLGCTNSTCLGKAEGSICIFPEECSPGLSCINSVCQQQRTQQGVCYSDLHCQNDFACDQPGGGHPGTCVPYFSLSESAQVQSCPGPQLPTISTIPFVNLLCKSASCVFDPSSGSASCVEAPVSVGKLPMKCQTNNDCGADDSPDGVKITTECGACGFNLAGTTYCNLFPGDSYFRDLIKKTQDWIESSSVKECNTAHRWDCMAVVWEKKQAEEWQYYFDATTLYSQLAGAEKCVAQVLFPNFYAEKEAMALPLALGVLAMLASL